MPKQNSSKASKKSQKKYSAVPPTVASAPKPVIMEIPVVETAKEVVVSPVAATPEAATPVVTAEPVAQPTEAIASKPDTSAEREGLVAELESPSPAQRATAATKLGDLGDKAAVGALASALRDYDADVARDAAAALGQLGDTTAVAPLIEALSNRDGYTHPVVRAAAASSLGLLGDTQAVQPLLNAIDDEMAEASAEAIRALATIGDTRAVSSLIDVVRNLNGFFLDGVRRAAVLGLAKLGGEQAAAELRAVAADPGEDTVIRQDAEEASRQAMQTKND